METCGTSVRLSFWGAVANWRRFLCCSGSASNSRPIPWWPTGLGGGRAGDPRGRQVSAPSSPAQGQASRPRPGGDSHSSGELSSMTKNTPTTPASPTPCPASHPAMRGWGGTWRRLNAPCRRSPEPAIDQQNIKTSTDRLPDQPVALNAAEEAALAGRRGRVRVVRRGAHLAMRAEEASKITPACSRDGGEGQGWCRLVAQTTGPGSTRGWPRWRSWWGRSRRPAEEQPQAITISTLGAGQLDKVPSIGRPARRRPRAAPMI